MKELRVNDPPIRIFYAFDPRRSAILLIGGDKTGDMQFYDRMIAAVDTLYAQHLAHLGDIMPTKPWREIRREHSKLTKAARAEIDSLVRAEIELMRLPALRKARHLSQAAIADVLHIAQGDVSKIERRTDVYIRTLRRYIEAAGGTLRIVADFPDSQPIEIDGFADIEAPGSVARRRPAKRRKAANSGRRSAAG